MLFYKLALCLLFLTTIANAKPGLKQGGAACIEQNYCQNGGTCYTQYTQQPVTVTSPTTTAVTTPSSTQPACVPQVATTTSSATEACIPAVVTTTQATTQPPTTTQYVWVTEPVCGCQPQYVGDRCEQPVTPQPTQAPTQPSCMVATQAPAVLTGCAAISCLNGGYCNEISIQPYGVCVCTSQFTGSRCETSLPSIPIVVTHATTVASTVASTVAPANDDPYNNPAMVTTQATFTYEPHCNFTIKLENDGAYTARMRVGYKIDGVQQPLWTSANLPIIGNKAEVTIPWYSTDIVVSLERLGFNWAGIVQDTGIDSMHWCNKCYKVWGDVSNPKWDYSDCS